MAAGEEYCGWGLPNGLRFKNIPNNSTQTARPVLWEIDYLMPISITWGIPIQAINSIMQKHKFKTKPSWKQVTLVTKFTHFSIVDCYRSAPLWQWQCWRCHTIMTFIYIWHIWPVVKLNIQFTEDKWCYFFYFKHKNNKTLDQMLLTSCNQITSWNIFLKNQK